MRLSAQFSLTTAIHPGKIVRIKQDSHYYIEPIRVELVRETQNMIYHNIIYTSLSKLSILYRHTEETVS